MREQAGGLARQLEVAAEPLRPLGGQLGDRRSCPLQHVVRRRERHEIRLGEVAVVVRLLLRAQRRQRARARVEVERLLLDVATLRDDLLLTRDLGLDAAP